MRILIVANIPPYAKGGAETQARFLAEEFVALGHSVTVAGNEIPKNIHNENYSFNAVHIATLRSTKLSRGLSYFVSLAWYVLRNRKNFDVIYCRFLGEAALSVCVIKQFFRLDIPLVPCTACAGKMGDAEYVMQLPLSGYLINLINKHCNAINNISPKTGEELISIGIDSTLLKYFPNGIRFKNLKAKKAVSKVRKLVYVGRLVPQKAIPCLLDAVRLLVDEGLKFELHLIGDGSDREALELYVRENNFSEYVFFHGYIDNCLIAEHLPSYDIFVLPSLYEGFATATIEAMFSGLPAVVTMSGGPEYFVDAAVGRVCEPGNSSALATSLSEVLHLSDVELLEMGARGRQRVIERFNIKSIAKDYIELFEKLIK